MAETFRLSSAEFQAMAARITNWGRWGPDDDQGTLRFITPETRRSAAALVREGITVSLAQNLPVAPAVDNPRPTRHLVFRSSSGHTGATLDYLTLEPHGWSMTHLDALNHIFYEGRTYNGRPVEEITAAGSAANSIMTARDGIFARGVLLDIPRAVGRAWLDPGDAASEEDVAAALAMAGSQVRSGDVIVFRTGRYARNRALGTPAPAEGLAGISIALAPWVHASEAAALICDGGMDPQPSEVEGTRIPWHIATLALMGMQITDNADLEELAETCARLQRWEFLVAVAPLRLPGGTSSPVNPIAVF